MGKLTRKVMSSKQIERREKLITERNRPQEPDRCSIHVEYPDGTIREYGFKTHLDAVLFTVELEKQGCRRKAND